MSVHLELRHSNKSITKCYVADQQCITSVDWQAKYAQAISDVALICIYIDYMSSRYRYIQHIVYNPGDVKNRIRWLG